MWGHKMDWDMDAIGARRRQIASYNLSGPNTQSPNLNSFNKIQQNLYSFIYHNDRAGFGRAAHQHL